MPLEDNINPSETKSSKKRLAGLIDKIKYTALIPVIITTVACSNDYKKIYDGNNVKIYANRNASQIRIEKDSRKRGETFIFQGPTIRSLFDLEEEDLRLMEYKNKLFGFFNNKTYRDHSNVVDKAFLEIKEQEGRQILKDNAENMEIYLKK